MSAVVDLGYGSENRRGSPGSMGHNNRGFFEVTSDGINSNVIPASGRMCGVVVQADSGSALSVNDAFSGGMARRAVFFLVSNSLLDNGESELIPAKVFLEDVSARAAGNELKATRNLLDGIEKRFSQSRLREVDYICEHVDFSLLGKYAAIGLVKTTNRCRLHLPKWEAMYTKACECLVERGVDPGVVFSNIK